MRLFKKNKRGNETMVLQGEVASASRAVYQGRRELPTIEMKFKVRHGHHKGDKKDFDEVIIEMNAMDANDYARELLAALNAAIPRVARGAQHTQYGE